MPNPNPTESSLSLDESCFPEFVEGQSLTHLDLNLLRDFLYSRIGFQSRAILGFGVGCGLEGSIQGGKLRIGPGFALAHGGRDLVLASAAEFSLSGVPGPLLTPTPGFIDTGQGGYTAILLPTETWVEPTDECGETTGCRAHGHQWCQGTEIRFAEGRLKPPAWSAAKIFTLEPLDPKKNPTKAQFNALAAAIADELKGQPGAPILDAATLKLLTDLKLTDVPATDLMKIGLVNEILYLAWEYFRCVAIQGSGCFGVTGDPMVALGWLSKPGGTWTWECRYRHHFELSLALYRAINGFGCRDLCSRSLDQIRVLLETFEPPVVPPGPSGPGGPKVDVDICKVKGYWSWGCNPLPTKPIPGHIYAGLIDPSKYVRKPRKLFPKDLLWDPPKIQELIQPEDLMIESGVFDPADSGLIRTFDFVGQPGSEVKTAVEDAIKGIGGKAQVETMPVGDLADIDGFEQRLVVAASDSIYLGVNADGNVISVGAVPTSFAIGERGAVPGLRDDVDKMGESVVGLAQGVEKVEKDFTAFKEDYTVDFDEFKESMKGDFETFKEDYTVDFNQFRKSMEGDFETFKDDYTKTIKEDYTKDLETFKQDYTKDLESFKQDYTKDLETFKQDHTADFDQFKGSMEGDLETFKQDYTKDLETFKGDYATEEAMTAGLEQIRGEIMAEVAKVQLDVTGQAEQMKGVQQDLESQSKGLKETAEKTQNLEVELTSTKEASDTNTSQIQLLAESTADVSKAMLEFSGEVGAHGAQVTAHEKALDRLLGEIR